MFFAAFERELKLMWLMMIEHILMLALMLLAVHWLCDYPLQGDFLSKAKQSCPLRVYHLMAHAGIQGAGVALVTGSISWRICGRPPPCKSFWQ